MSFVVPSNFRYVRFPILVTDTPATDDRVFDTLDEAKAWVADIATKLIHNHENTRDTCEDRDEYQFAIRGIERARQLLETVQEMTI